METHDTFGEQLHVVENKLLRRLNQIAGFHGLTLSQAAFLDCIANRSENALQKDIEKVFDVRSSTASQVLSALEKKSFIFRAPKAGDSRCKTLSVTAAGQEALQAYRDEFLAFDAELSAQFSPEECTQLFSILRRLANYLDRT